MAAASIHSNAADSRDVIARALGGKYDGPENSTQPGRVEDN
jgi:hypothetical protein